MIHELLIAFALRSLLLCSSLLFRVILIQQNFALSLSLSILHYIREGT
jgi:hypothetical protein